MGTPSLDNREGNALKLYKQRLSEIQMLRLSLTQASNQQQEFKIANFVPPEFAVYVQRATFEQFDKEFERYKSAGVREVEVPEVNIEHMLVQMDDFNEFGEH